MWRNWNLNLPVNQLPSDSEEENNYESPPEEDPNVLVSPHRPHQSPSASPRALLRPDPPPVEEVLQEVGQQLRALPTREERAANRNAVRQAQEEAAAAAANVATMPDVVEFELEDSQDGAKASELGRQIKVEFSETDVRFWFAELEAEMTMATIKSQWLKKTVLQRNLPTKQKEDVKALLTLPQAQAGPDIYQKIKKELIRIYAPKPKDSYCKALTRTMVGLPSQLGNQLVNDVCKKGLKLEGCCCAAAVEALWHLQLPVNIRAHVSNMEFTCATYKQVFEAADKIFQSSKQISLAAMQVAAVTTDLDETQAAFNPENQPSQLAAFGRGGGRANRGGRGGRNNNGSNNQNGSGRGGRNNRGGGSGRGGAQTRKRHTSNPPESCCDRHYTHGAGAWYCLAPTTCPWADKCTPKQ